MVRCILLIVFMAMCLAQGANAEGSFSTYDSRDYLQTLKRSVANAKRAIEQHPAQTKPRHPNIQQRPANIQQRPANITVPNARQYRPNTAADFMRSRKRKTRGGHPSPYTRGRSSGTGGRHNGVRGQGSISR